MVGDLDGFGLAIRIGNVPMRDVRVVVDAGQNGVLEFVDDEIVKAEDSACRLGEIQMVGLLLFPGFQLWRKMAEVELDPASATAVSLWRCLVRERGEAFAEAAPPADKLSPLTNGRARLLIGDQAIRFRRKFENEYQYLDLGEAWQRQTNLPFVFALWLIRPEVGDATAIADDLRRTRDANLERLDAIIQEQTEFPAEFCSRYYRENLSFRLGEKEKAGLRLFGELCAKHGLLPSRPKDLRLV